MEQFVIWSNLDLKLDDWRERVLENSPELAGDEAAMEKRMWELNNLRLLDARINFDEELDGAILALGEVRVGEESAPVYKLYPSQNPSAIFYTDSPEAAWFVDRDGELKSLHRYPGGTVTVRYRVFKENTEPAVMQRLTELIGNGLAPETLIREYTTRLSEHAALIYKLNIPQEAPIEE